MKICKYCEANDSVMTFKFENFCTPFCKSQFENNGGLSLKQETTGESGIQELGEQKRESKEEKQPIESEKDPKNIEKKTTLELENEEKIPTSELKIKPEDENTIIETETSVISEETIIVEPIEKKQMNTNENTTQKIEPETLKELTIDEEKDGLQLASIQLSKMLKEENEGSVKLLDSMSRQAIGYAIQLAKPQKIDEETGEVIQNAPTHQIMDAVKCLDLARNSMNSKLDFMKFGDKLSQRLEKFLDA